MTTAPSRFIFVPDITAEGVEKVPLDAHPLVIAVDPGKNGALSIWTKDFAGLLDFKWVWENQGKFLRFLSECLTLTTVPRVFIETSLARPPMGAKSGFMFGKTIGKTELFFELAGLEYTNIAPKAWKAEAFGKRKKYPKELSVGECEKYTGKRLRHDRAEAFLFGMVMYRKLVKKVGA